MEREESELEKSVSNAVGGLDWTDGSWAFMCLKGLNLIAQGSFFNRMVPKCFNPENKCFKSMESGNYVRALVSVSSAS
jgi:hypothetical protein